MEIDDKLESLSIAIINGKHLDAQKITQELLTNNVLPQTILDNALMKGMAIVGERFRDQLIFVPQVLIAARAMKFAMKALEPYLIKGGVASKGRILIGTVKGDVHDIGKNLVAIMLQGCGYEVIDIGTGCSAEKFHEEYIKCNADVIGMSALLTTTMIYMESVIKFFREKNIKIPIIVGGAPLNQKFADEIGSSGFARNAYDAVQLVDSIMATKH
ncbi:MAG: corrinoid protein [Ignavibacteriales bacterium]|nr:corrinoid protein [Ignavibacteriales bacterium]